MAAVLGVFGGIRNIVRNTVNSVKDRVTQARGGRELFEMGTDTRDGVHAKGYGVEAFISDQETLAKFLLSVQALQGAAAEMRKAAEAGDVDGIEKNNYLQLAEEYEARAAAHQQAATMLAATEILPPEWSQEEQDCMNYIHADEASKGFHEKFMAWQTRLGELVKATPARAKADYEHAAATRKLEDLPGGEMMRSSQIRINTAIEGRVLFDTNAETRAAVGAKGQGVSAFLADEDSAEKLSQAVVALKDAAVLLRQAAAASEGAEGFAETEYEKLADQYEARAFVYQDAVEAMKKSDAVYPPECTQAEQDCLRFIGSANGTEKMTAAVLDHLKKVASLVKETPGRAIEEIKETREKAAKRASRASLKGNELPPPTVTHLEESADDSVTNVTPVTPAMVELQEKK